MVGKSHIVADLTDSHASYRMLDTTRLCAREKLALRCCDSDTQEELLAHILSWRGGDVRDIDDPTEHEEAMRAAGRYRRLGDGLQEGRMLLRAGAARLLPGEAGEGERLLLDAEARLSAFGDSKSLAQCQSALATPRLLAGDIEGARDLHARTLDSSRCTELSLERAR